MYYKNVHTATDSLKINFLFGPLRSVLRLGFESELATHSLIKELPQERSKAKMTIDPFKSL